MFKRFRRRKNSPKLVRGSKFWRNRLRDQHSPYCTCVDCIKVKNPKSTEHHYNRNPENGIVATTKTVHPDFCKCTDCIKAKNIIAEYIKDLKNNL